MTPNPLVDAYQAAVCVKVDLDMTPRWRRRKRARLQEQLTKACQRADRERARLGIAKDAPFLADLFEGLPGA